MIDSHCHIHMSNYGLDGADELKKARAAGVKNVIVVGEGAEDSQVALSFASSHACYAAIGLHPHNADQAERELPGIEKLAETKPAELVAIGECGLDYYYLRSSKQQQRRALERQIELALRLGLPLIFHVRSSANTDDAYQDFFSIIDNFGTVEGVVHSFSAGQAELDGALARGLMIGLNGIMTFSRDARQLAAARQIPLNRLLLETDSPFLTPVPFRGKINSPLYLVEVASFLSELRKEENSELRAATTINAESLFKLK